MSDTNMFQHKKLAAWKTLLCRGASGLFVLLFLVGSVPLWAQWQPVGTLDLPDYAYSFLATTPDGNLLAATFNNQSMESKNKVRIPALLIESPKYPNPKVTQLCMFEFENQRGYGGIASDNWGNFFVSGDTGERDTSFFAKFDSEGKIVREFGRRGVVFPKRRCLGIEVLGRFLFLAVDWGEILVFDSKTGKLSGKVPPAPGEVYLRDVAINPRTLELFGVAKGGVIRWSKGVPWSPEKYQISRVSPEMGILRSGEGIGIDPFTGRILISPIPGKVLQEITEEGIVAQTVVTTTLANAHLADSVLSFDGKTLYLSDMAAKKIHILQRQSVSPRKLQVVKGSGKQAGNQGAVKPVKWFRSYSKVVQAARDRQLPMVVYFGSQNVGKCQEVQESLFKTENFQRKAQDFVCVYEDVASNRLMAYRLGVYRVPHVILLGRNGETVGEYTFNINPGDVFDKMEKIR